MCLGDIDHMVSNIEAKKLFDNLTKAKSKELLVYENSSHAIHMQDGMQQPLQKDVTKWLLKITTESVENMI